MDALRKKIFVEELCANVQQEIIAAVPHMPEDWDGRELRQYIADKFRESTMPDTLNQTRKRAYNNELIINSRL